MTSLGFENYAEALKIYLAKYREVSPHATLDTSRENEQNPSDWEPPFVPPVHRTADLRRHNPPEEKTNLDQEVDMAVRLANPVEVLETATAQLAWQASMPLEMTY